MSQISFSDAEYAGKRKKTRREVFLEEMELVVPWKVLLGLIEPHYPVAGRGRRPYPLESMLRVHLMQNWFALSDPAMEEALYEIASLRSFAHLYHRPRPGSGSGVIWPVAKRHWQTRHHGCRRERLIRPRRCSLSSCASAGCCTPRSHEALGSRSRRSAACWLEPGCPS
jgi:IS5 family transposase